MINIPVAAFPDNHQVIPGILNPGNGKRLEQNRGYTLTRL